MILPTKILPSAGSESHNIIYQINGRHVEFIIYRSFGMFANRSVLQIHLKIYRMHEKHLRDFHFQNWPKPGVSFRVKQSRTGIPIQQMRQPRRRPKQQRRWYIYRIFTIHYFYVV